MLSLVVKASPGRREIRSFLLKFYYFLIFSISCCPEPRLFIMPYFYQNILEFFFYAYIIQKTACCVGNSITFWKGMITFLENSTIHRHPDASHSQILRFRLMVLHRRLSESSLASSFQLPSSSKILHP